MSWKNAIENVAALGVIAGLTLFAFSRPSLTAIRERANYKSEISYLKNRPLTASHINHSRKHALYDDPRMGIYMTDIEHYLFHLNFRGCSNLIGLPEHQNEWAIQKRLEAVEAFNQKSGQKMPDQDTLNRISLSIERKVTERTNDIDGLQNPYELRDYYVEA